MTKPLTKEDLVPITSRLDFLERSYQSQSSQYIEVIKDITALKTDFQGMRAQAQAHSEKHEKAISSLEKTVVTYFGEAMDSINMISTALGLNSDPNSRYYLERDLKALREKGKWWANTRSTIARDVLKLLVIFLISCAAIGVVVKITENAKKIEGLEARE